MKMNYPLIRNRKEPGRGTPVTPFLFAVGIIVLFGLLFPRILGEALMTIAQPLWNAKGFVVDSSRDFFGYFRSKKELVSEMRFLAEDALTREAELADRRLLEEENRKLTEMLGRRARDARILATILVSPPHSPYDTLVLDAGRREGVAVGDEVLIKNVALGKIIDVFARTSVAELFSTAGNRVNALIAHEEKYIPTEAVGEGGGFFSAILPRDVVVASGDAVILSGLPSRVVAFVEAIERGSSDSFQTLFFKIPVSVNEARFVEIRQIEKDLSEPR